MAVKRHLTAVADETRAAAAKYCFIAALLAVATIGALHAVGLHMNTAFASDRVDLTATR